MRYSLLPIGLIFVLALTTSVMAAPLPKPTAPPTPTSGPPPTDPPPPTNTSAPPTQPPPPQNTSPPATTAAPLPTQTATRRPAATRTSTPTATPTATRTPTATATRIPTASATPSATATRTTTATATPTAAATLTPTASETLTTIPTPTDTAVVTATSPDVVAPVSTRSSEVDSTVTPNAELLRDVPAEASGSGLPRWQLLTAASTVGLVAVLVGLDLRRRRRHRALSPVIGTAEKPRPVLEIYGLGLARVVVEDRTLTNKDWQALTSRDLFFYLVCEGPVTRDQLASVFWPNSSFDQIRNTFHSAIYRARGALSPLKDVIVFENNTYSFNRQVDYVFDVETFEQLMKIAKELTATDPSGAIDAYSKGVDLFKGEFLEDYASPNDEWRVIRASGLLEKCLDASEKLGGLLLQQERYDDALEVYKRAQERDPYRESVGRGVMLSYAMLGQRVEALRHYQELKARIKAELGTSVMEETEKLYQRVRSDRPRSA